MTDTYELQQKPSEENALVAIMRVPVQRVCEHFAVRFEPTHHPAGEGMMAEAFVLDHIPSGLAAWREAWGWLNDEQCRAFAASLHSAPVDWSQKEPQLPEGFGRFTSKARDLALEVTALDYEAWAEKA